MAIAAVTRALSRSRKYFHTHIQLSPAGNTVFKDFIYREEKGRRKRGRETSHVVASHASLTRDLAHNPGMCPRPGIEPATLWFAGQHSIH